MNLSFRENNENDKMDRVEHILKANASAVERVNNKGIDTNKKYILFLFYYLEINKK